MFWTRLSSFVSRLRLESPNRRAACCRPTLEFLEDRFVPSGIAPTESGSPNYGAALVAAPSQPSNTTSSTTNGQTNATMVNQSPAANPNNQTGNTPNPLTNASTTTPQQSTTANLNTTNVLTNNGTSVPGGTNQSILVPTQPDATLLVTGTQTILTVGTSNGQLNGSFNTALLANRETQVPPTFPAIVNLPQQPGIPQIGVFLLLTGGGGDEPDYAFPPPPF